MPWNENFWEGPPPTYDELVAALGREPDDIECDCCRSELAPLEVYGLPSGCPLWEERRDGGKPPHELLCQFCARTLAGSWSHWPGRSSEVEVLKTICHIGNALMHEIRSSAIVDRRKWGK